MPERDYPTLHSTAIKDNFKSFYDIKRQIYAIGLTEIQSMFAIDFSKSNKWQGEICRGGKSLHDLSPGNPYLEIFDILTPALSLFDSDGIIPVFRFGCISSKNNKVLPLENGHSGLYQSFEYVVEGYKRVASSNIRMSGPTSFAAIIDEAICYSQRLANKYFIFCVIITDGDVDEVDDNKEALAKASSYPIEFVAIGVGDGPFEKMQEFDDFEQRRFDNFQFVCYQEMRSQLVRMEEPEVKMAFHMMMEIPDCFDQITRLGVLKR